MTQPFHSQYKGEKNDRLAFKRADYAVGARFYQIMLDKESSREDPDARQLEQSLKERK